jgi:cell division protein ZapA (FtsZ GTPase activity inhibitor)
VEILGRPLTLTSTMLPDQIQSVAHIVDEQLRELQRAFPTSSLAELAILAALNLALENLENQDNVQELQENYRQLQTEIEQRSRQLLRKLEVCDVSAPPGPWFDESGGEEKIFFFLTLYNLGRRQASTAREVEVTPGWARFDILDPEVNRYQYRKELGGSRQEFQQERRTMSGSLAASE